MTLAAGEGMRGLRDVATWLHLSSKRVSELYANKLHITGIRPDTLAMLSRIPPAAWGTDGLMRTRILSTLVEEFPVSIGTAGLSAATAFVDDDAFWPVLHERLSLPEGFGRFICPTVGDLAVLETEISLTRRRFVDSSGLASLGVRLASGVSALSVQDGAFAAWTLAWSHGVDLPSRVASGERLASATGSGERTALLIQVTGAPPAALVSETSAELVEVFTWLKHEQSAAAVLVRLQNAGLSAAEANELLSEWRVDGMIVG